ncbi:MAG: FRG domain-containing protein [Candidatus Delongbacteria bacterium]|nr:FRG domain-containing protein [Candidatus Delongbacteria bacterium]
MEVEIKKQIKSPVQIIKEIIENPDILKSWEFPLFSFQEFEDKVKLYQENKEDKLLLFRGQRSASKGLMPSVYRGFENINLIENEIKKLDEFKQILKERHPKVYLEIKSDWDFLGLAQHYGIKTRLLDWTSNPYIALWFACIDEIKDDGEKASSVYVYFADKIDLVDTQETSPFDTGIGSYKVYKPHKLPLNKRLIHQSGYFTVHCYNTEVKRVLELPFHKPVKDKIAKLIVPQGIRKQIIDILYEKGISHSKIYPDFDGACKEVEWRNRLTKTIILPEYQELINDLKYLISNSIEILNLMNDYDFGKSAEYAFYFLIHNYTKAQTILGIIENKKFKDIPSATILLRSIFEGYINMYDIFSIDLLEQEKEIKIARAKAISDYETKVFLDYIDEHPSEDKDYFLIKIDNWKNSIRNMEYFKNLNDEDKNYYIDIENWFNKKYKGETIDKAKNAGINENNANLICQYSSNYLHADPYAIGEIEIFAKNGIPNCFITSLLIQTIAILAKTINLFTQTTQENEITSDRFRTILALYWEKMEKDLRKQE